MAKCNEPVIEWPQAIELEQAVLGQILQDARVFPDILEVVPKPDIFYKTAHQHIYRAMQDLYQRDIAIDCVSVASGLQERGILGATVGSRVDLMELCENVASTANAVHYATLIQQKYAEREVLKATYQIQEKFRSQDVENIKDVASQLIYDAGRVESPIPPLQQQVTKAIDFIEQGFHGQAAGYPWGLRMLDRLTGGICPGKLTVLAALKKSGKTKFLVRMIAELLESGVPVLFFSLEMRDVAVLRWLASYREQIDSSNLGTTRLTEAERQATLQCLAGIATQGKLVIDDRSSPTLGLIRQRVRREVQRHGVRVVMLDFLQRANMEEAKGESRASAVQRFSYGIADLARDFNVGIILVAQLSNEAEKTGSLHLGFIKESGGVAEAADCIILLDNKSRREHNRKPTPGEKVEIDLIVDAQRDGVSGLPVHTLADLRYGRFFEITNDKGGD